MPDAYDDQQREPIYDEEKSPKKPAGSKKDKDNKDLSPDQLADGEKKAGSGIGGKVAGAASAATALAAPEAAAAKVVAGSFGSRHKKGLIGGGIGAGVFVGLALTFMGLLPHAVNARVSFYESRAFRGLMQNLDDSSENFIQYYLRHHVLKALGPNCPRTRITASCVKKLPGDNPVSRTINAMIGANVEGNLARDAGIVFGRDNLTGRIYMVGPGLPDNGVDIQEFADGRANLFDLPAVSQSDARRALREALARQTFYRRAFMRFQLRDVLKRYGVVRCIVACTYQENRQERRDARELRRKRFLYETAARVLMPRNAGYRLAVGCVFDPNCDPNKVVDTNGPNGAQRTDFQSRLEAERAAFAVRYGKEKLALIDKRVSELLTKGMPTFAVDLIFGEVVGKKIRGLVPYLGWADTAFVVVEALKDAGPKVRGIRYALAAADMVGMYVLYKSIAEEGKAGRVDSASMGGFAESLTSIPADENGNHSNAEATKLYDNFLDQPGSSTALLPTIFPTAFAEPTGENKFYRCNDDYPEAAGFLVCQEELLRAGVGLIDDISNIIPAPVALLASAWNSTVGAVFGWILGPVAGWINAIPGVLGIDDLIEKATKPLMETIRDYLFPSAVSTNMSGGRRGNLVAGGAVKTANDAAHYALGGQVLSVDEYQDLQFAAAQNERERFMAQPLSYRLFDKDDPDSFVSRIALALPTDFKTSTRDTIASIIVNPFMKLIQTIASLFTTRSALAIATQPNPWGDTTYGYRYTDTIFDTDPEAYYTQNCADGTFTANWNTSTTVNDETMQLENTTPNPCLLIEATAESLGAMYGVPQPGEGATGEQ